MYLGLIREGSGSYCKDIYGDVGYEIYEKK